MRLKFLAILALTAAGLPGQTCDRGCLESFVDRYMDALIAHDPKKLPLTPRLKMTENGQRLEPGDGFWRTATAKGTYRLFVDDPQQSTVAFLGTMREADIPVVVAIRLKVTGGQIPEIETFVVRNAAAATNLEKLGAPALSASQKSTREELTQTANLYFAGLEKSDGRGNYPFTEDCNRIENGQQTTNNPDFRMASLFESAPAGPGRGGRGGPPPAPPLPDPSDPARLGCKEQFQSGYFHFTTRVRDRRIVAVDPEHGLAFAFVLYDYAGKEATGPKRPWTWERAEVLQMANGKIRQVLAIMEQVPYGMASGW
jgi:hypothetical protein